MTRSSAAPGLGALTGFLLSDYEGMPAWMFILAVSVSLMFGIFASIGREGERRVTVRHAIFNSGALWVLTCSLAFQMTLSIEVAAIFALVIGLLGGQALRVVESWGGGALDWMLRQAVPTAHHPVTKEELDEMLGQVRDQTQAALSEQSVKGKHNDDHG